MKVFISGAMTGHIDNNFPAFFKAERELKEQGHEVVNPARIFIALPFIPSWEQCMKIALKELMDCQAIHTLEGWQKSKGATVEVDLAHKLGYSFVKQLEYNKRDNQVGENLDIKA